MKKIVLAIIIIITGFSAIAQSEHSDLSQKKKFRGSENYSNEHNFKDLNLTDDQKARIKTLNKDFRQQMQNLNKNKKTGDNDVKEKRQALVKEHREKINTILTAEQQKQVKDMKRDLAKEHKVEKRSERFDEMTKDLNLTPDQSAKMQKLGDTFKSNILSLHQNTSLSQDEKKEQMKSLMKKHKTDMEALLTDEQKEQMKSNRKKRNTEAI